MTTMEQSLATGAHYGEGTLMNTDRQDHNRDMSQFFNETEILDDTMRVQQSFHNVKFLKSSDSKESINHDIIFSEDFL